MSRNMKDITNDIFNALINYVEMSKENVERIKQVERWLILPEALDRSIFQFVTKTKDEVINGLNEKFIRIFDDNNTYIVATKNYGSVFKEIGLHEVEDLTVIYGCGIIAIAKGIVGVKSELSTLEVIDYCLGIEEEGQTPVKFEIEQIFKLFETYSVYEIDNGVFQLNYQEDFYRIQALHEMEQYEGILNLDTIDILSELVQLPSSRSIVESVIIALRSKVLTHSYLEIYQCLEYLFIVRRAILQAEKYSFDLKTLVDYIIQESIRVPERQDITDIIKDNISDEELLAFLDIKEDGTMERKTKIDKVAEIIYRVRCNIAHLKYGQETLAEMSDMQKMIEKVSKIVLLVYSKRDGEITNLCMSTGAWRKLRD